MFDSVEGQSVPVGVVQQLVSAVQELVARPALGVFARQLDCPGAKPVGVNHIGGSAKRMPLTWGLGAT